MKRMVLVAVAAVFLYLVSGYVMPAFAKGTQAELYQGFFLLFVGGLIFGTAAFIFAHRFFTNSIVRLTDHVTSLNNGGKQISEISGLKYKSGVGGLAEQIDRLSQKHDGKLRNVEGHASTLLCASQNILKLSKEVLYRCDTTRSSTKHLSEESGQIEENISAIVAAVDQAYSNIELVADASDEIYTRASEISKNMEKARGITQEAVSLSCEAETGMGRLGGTVGQITQITATLSEISEQANILAVYAMIESSCADESGKGFVVVANEIKSLAEQTSGATKKIKEIATEISVLTQNSRMHIHDATNVIRHMDHSVNSIAKALEHQSAATRDIAENAAKASRGIGDIKIKVVDTSKEVRVMANHIQNICYDADGIGMCIFESCINSDETQSVADILMKSANGLTAKAPQFDIGNIKLAHMGWRTDLEAVLAGHKHMEPDQMAAHTDCAFGQWYFNEGKIFSSLDLYNEIGVLHKKVHTQAMAVIRKQNAEDDTGAKQEMEKFIDTKTMLFDALDRLYLI